MKILLMLLIVVLMFIPICSADTLEFSDDFNRADNETVGNGWTESHEASSRINNSQLKILYAGADYQTVHRTLTASGLYNYSIIINASENNARRFFSIYGTTANKKFVIYFKDDGDIAYYNGDTSFVCGTYAANTDYNLTIQYNQTNGSAKYYINNVYKAEVIVGRTTADTNIIEIAGGVSGTTFWDNMYVWNITTDGAVAPTITSSSPSTPTDSYVNQSKTFNASSDQDGNWTWYIDSVLMKNSEINTANATYTNSTAPNGTVYNVTAIITNANGSAQTSWNWTTLKNYITSNATYLDGTNVTIVCIFNVSYVSPGTTQWGFNFSWTNAGQQYDWTYPNDTIIQSLTASSTNETLEFMKAPPLPTGIYYIQKASAVTIETFVVAVGAFAAVVVAGAAVISRRVRRSISGFWNRRIRRR